MRFHRKKLQCLARFGYTQANTNATETISPVPSDIIEEIDGNPQQPAELSQIPSRRDSLGTITKQIQKQLRLLTQGTPKEFDQVMTQFRSTFDEAIAASVSHAEDYTNQAASIETALATLTEYNKRVLEQLNQMTITTLKRMSGHPVGNETDQIKSCETMVERAKHLVATAEKQVEYSRKMGQVTRPLALWRLEASKALWEANTTLKMAEKTHTEALESKNVTKVLEPVVVRIPGTIKQPEFDEHVRKLDRPGAIVLPSSNQHEAAQSQTKTQSKLALLDSDISNGSKFSESSLPLLDDAALSKRPPIKIWPKHVYTNSAGEVICYIRAPRDCLRRKEDMHCLFSELYAPWPQIAGHSEPIGRFVSIKPAKPNSIQILRNEPWIIGIPHSYVKHGSRESVLYMIEAGARGVAALEEDTHQVKQTELVAWRDLHTTDVISGDKHFLEVRLPRINLITLAPCARLRCDTVEVGRPGGRLVCLTDKRIALNIPTEAVRVTLPFTLQVQQIDSQQLHMIKEQNKLYMGDFISCSPLVYLTCAHKIPFKPVTLTLPVVRLGGNQITPTAVSLADRTTDKVDRRLEVSTASDEMSGTTPIKLLVVPKLDGFQKSLIVPQLYVGNRAEASEIVLMQKSERTEGKWIRCKYARLITNNGDEVTFELERILPARFLAIQMRSVGDPEVLCRCATTIEKSLWQHMAYFSLRQHREQPNNLCLTLSLEDQLEDSIQSMAVEGYVNGDKPIGPVFLHERQQLDLTFGANIRLVPSEEHTGPGIKITFNSAMNSPIKFTIEAIDVSAQIGLDHHRGFLDINCMRDVLVPTNQIGVGTSSTVGRTQRLSISGPRLKKSRFRLVTERSQLARIVVQLPKPSNQSRENQIKKRHSFDFTARDMVTPRYLKELSKKLTNDSWRRLGLALNLSRSRLQAIGSCTNGGLKELAYAMLMSWIKTLPIATDRFALLYNALHNIGRADLVLDMCTLSGEYEDDEMDDHDFESESAVQ